MNPLQPRFNIATFLKFSAALSLFLALEHTSGVDRIFGRQWPESVLVPLAVALCCTCTIMRPRATPRWCRSCGRSCRPSRYGASAALCPTCRVAGYSPAQRRRAEILGLGLIAGLIALLVLAILWPFSALLEARHGRFAYPVLAGVLVALLIPLSFCMMVARALVRSWRMSRPGHALKVARACAGDTGRRAAFAGVEVYLFGRNDPTPMLEQAFATCRSRCERLAGRPWEAERPLRVLSFGKRVAFERFCGQMLVSPGNLDGFFIPWSTPTIALNGDSPPWRLVDHARVVRMLMTYYYLDGFQGGRSPFWLQAGIANVVACGGDEEELARLNRKMMAALHRGGGGLDASYVFHVDPRAMLRMLRGWQNRDAFTKHAELVAQAFSLAEYLCGQAAPEDRRQRFRAFLTDAKGDAAHEPLFERHFGRGFAGLIEDWRGWVLQRGVGIHHPPADAVRCALLGRVIPIVRNREASRLERILAIREMGRAGYVLGADTLIDILRGDDEIDPGEAVWALEAISGLILGDDVRRWDHWLAQLPGEVTGLVRAMA